DNVIADDVEDVELILKRAEDIALETESLLKSSAKTNAVASSSLNSAAVIPEIKVTKADNEYEGNKTLGNAKVSQIVFVQNTFYQKYEFLFLTLVNPALNSAVGHG
ncbi:Uncharacterized protein OBRU01_26275, partial [Operophtera brumata]